MTAFETKRGDTWSQAFTWKQGSADGAPVDLTGCTPRLQLRTKTGTLVLDATSYLTLTPLTGTVTVNVPAAVTALLPVGTVYFDLEITHADGSVRSTQTLSLVVLKDITYE